MRITPIVMPYKFQPRDYQIRVWNAFFVEKKKRFCLVWHRRSGKDKIALNILATAAQQRVGNYYYFFPTFNLARRVVWEGIDANGFKFVDHFPKELIKKVNQSELSIHFKNGSTVQLAGVDNYNFSRGINPVGMIFSEYAEMKPGVWDTLRPIVAENKGWCMFIFTPRGGNHAYDLYKTNVNNEDWYVERLGVEDTLRGDGTPVISQESIEDERKSGMSKEMIDQEFYCSFEAALQGAYFAGQLREAYEGNRVLEFEYDKSHPCMTFWDIGVNDSTVIWVMQEIGIRWYALAVYENNNEGVDHYIQWIRDFERKHGLIINKHFTPHDSVQRDKGTAIPYLETARRLGISMTPIRQIARKHTAIELVRRHMHKVYFHKEGCAYGLDCLRQYHKHYNQKMQYFSEKPVHDWSSHCVDAFMTWAQALEFGNIHSSTHAIMQDSQDWNPLF